MLAPTLPTVLVVDDELRSQEALRRTLDEEFEVFTASSAAEALEILAREWIQIDRLDPADYEKDLELFQASIDFVKGGRR